MQGSNNMKRRHQEVSKKLPEEIKKRKRAVAEVAAGLKRDSETWAISAETTAPVSLTLIETCLMPRVLFSPEDAMLCATFVLQAFKLQSFGTSYVFYLQKVCPAAPVICTRCNCLRVPSEDQLGLCL